MTGDEATPDAMIGLRDAVLRGWFNHESGALFPGFVVGADDVVADIGCGLGGYAEFCASRGARIILADADPDRLAAAAARLAMMPKPPSFEQHVTLGNPLPLKDGVASRVICSEVIEHVEDPAQLMAELARIGRQGALYLLSCPDPQSEVLQQRVAPPAYFARPNHIRILSHSDFAHIVEGAGLVIEDRQSFGFFWSIWLTLFWSTEGLDLDAPGEAGFAGLRHPVLDHWTRTWTALLDQPKGAEIKRAFDDLMPRSQLIIARKP